MKKPERYVSYAKEHFASLTGKRILLNGATGKIGEGAAHELAALGNDLVLLVRNMDAGRKLAESLSTSYGIKAEVVKFDYLDRQSLRDAATSLDGHVDFFVNVSGIYHQPEEIIDGIEKTFLVNYLRPIEFIELLLERFPGLKIVNVSSITYKTRIPFDPIGMTKDAYLEALSKVSGKHKRYALSKRLIFSALLGYRHEKGLDIRLLHPGVSCTNLFHPKNNAYPKIFYIAIPSLMKIVFMHPYKAALNIVHAMAVEPTEGKWSAPRGFLQVWGYPHLAKYSKSPAKPQYVDEIYRLSKELIAS